MYNYFIITDRRLEDSKRDFITYNPISFISFNINSSNCLLSGRWNTFCFIKNLSKESLIIIISFMWEKESLLTSFYGSVINSFDTIE